MFQYWVTLIGRVLEELGEISRFFGDIGGDVLP